jgi:RHS repeat-associated protein
MFTSRQWDPESGLYYYRARYYDAGLGRFLQADPAGYEADINLYRYCWNNTLNFVDPSGFWAVMTRDLTNRALATGARATYRENPVNGQHWQMKYDNGEDVGYLGDDQDRPIIDSDKSCKDKYDKQPLFKGQDDDAMREAERRAREYWNKEFEKGQRYHHNVFDNKRKWDCQEFIYKMLEEYFKILEERREKPCS